MFLSWCFILDWFSMGMWWCDDVMGCIRPTVCGVWLWYIMGMWYHYRSIFQPTTDRHRLAEKCVFHMRWNHGEAPGKPIGFRTILQMLQGFFRDLLGMVSLEIHWNWRVFPLEKTKMFGYSWIFWTDTQLFCAANESIPIILRQIPDSRGLNPSFG